MNRILPFAARIPVIFLPLMAFCLLFTACRNTPENPREINRAFYYWKSRFNLSSFEVNRLDSLQVNTIYIKYFDVDWDKRFSETVPVAQVWLHKDSNLSTKKIIPTVFITNEAIFNIDTNRLNTLAENMINLIDGINKINGLDVVEEIQIDCDWTPGTRAAYFTLLEQLQSLKPDILFSATIRLHQIKYLKSTGVPPVQKGLLMCYNMGNLKNPGVKNSILDPGELNKYIADLSDYPLPLDIGLPLFDWKLWYRDERFMGILETLPEAVFQTANFEKSGNNFWVRKDTNVQGYAFRVADHIRVEASNYRDILKVEEMLRTKLKGETLNLALFHLDSVILKKYTYDELETIFNGLH